MFPKLWWPIILLEICMTSTIDKKNTCVTVKCQFPWKYNNFGALRFSLSCLSFVLLAMAMANNGNGKHGGPSSANTSPSRPAAITSKQKWSSSTPTAVANTVIICNNNGNDDYNSMIFEFCWIGGNKWGKNYQILILNHFAEKKTQNGIPLEVKQDLTFEYCWLFFIGGGRGRG